MNSFSSKNPEVKQWPPNPAAIPLDRRSFAGLTFFLLLLFSLLAPIMSAGTGTLEPTSEGNGLRQVAYLLIFIVSVVTTVRLGSAGFSKLVPLSVMLLLAWCALSVVWAINPSIAVRRLLLTVIIIASIFLLVRENGYQLTIDIVRTILFLTVFANYTAVFLFPDWGIHQPSETDPSIVGAWRGILMHKNFAGPVCALTIIVFTLDANNVKRWIKALTIALTLYFLLRTESKTSMLVLALSMGVAGLFRVYRAQYRIIFILAAAIGLAALLLLAIQFPDWISQPFESEDTFTGRVQIWAILVDYWRDHWLLGSGFGSFWNVGDPEPISSYTNGWVSAIASGHNGYLDLLVQIGLPGLLLAIFAAFVSPAWQIISQMQLPSPRRSLIAAIVFFTFGHNLTESSLFDRDSFIHVLLMITIALLYLSRDNDPTSDAEAVSLPSRDDG